LPAAAHRLAVRFRPDPAEVWLWLGIALGAALLSALAVARPTTALLAAVGAAVVGVLLVRIDLAILAVVATAPLEAAFSSGPAGISFTKLAGGLCFLSFLGFIVRSRRQLLLDRSYVLVLGILAFAALSSLQALETGPAFSTTVRYASFAGFYVILSQLGHEPVLQRRIAWVLAVTASISAGLGLANYLDGSQQFAQLPYSNQNDFAFILATSLPLMFWLLGSRRSLRPVVVAMIALVFAATLLSLSRGALVGLGAGFVFLLLTDRRRLQLTLLAGTLAIVAAVVVVQSNPQRFQESLFLKQQVAQENVTTRFEAWDAAARLATDHPFLGVGPGNFQFYYNELTGRPSGTLSLTVAHNAYLDIGAELGLVAMLLFVIYLVMVFLRLTATIRDSSGPAGYAQALRISLVIAAVCAMFLSEQYFLPFWLIGGLATAMWASKSRAPARPVVPAAFR
jgi:putative inorganic carbon (HCO3(-)) transporter